MGTQFLIAAHLFFAAIQPSGWGYTQYPNQDTVHIYLWHGTDNDSVLSYPSGYYVGHLDQTGQESQVDFRFHCGGRTAFLVDTVGSNPTNHRVPEVFLYDSATGRHVTVSVYRLHDSTGLSIDSSLFTAELFNLTSSDSSQGYVYPETAFSDVLAHIRADAGDSLLLKISAPSGDTARFVSYRRFVAPDSGNDAVYVRNDSSGIPESRRNYGFINFPDSIEMLPRLDLGAAQIVAPTDTVDSGQTVTPQARVRNYGEVASGGTVRMRIGSSYQQDTSFGTLDPGDSAQVTFADWTATDSGTLLVSCSTMVAGDVNQGNDRLTDSVFVRGYVSWIASENQQQAVKPIPTILRAPVDLRRFAGELRDVLGRKVASLRLEPGVYYLVTPERTQKLLVVR